MKLQEGYRTFTSRGTERCSEWFWLVTDSWHLDVFNTKPALMFHPFCWSELQTKLPNGSFHNLQPTVEDECFSGQFELDRLTDDTIKTRRMTNCVPSSLQLCARCWNPHVTFGLSSRSASKQEVLSLNSKSESLEVFLLLHLTQIQSAGCCSNQKHRSKG